MQFRPTAVAVAELPCASRVPFRFGSVTVERAPLLHARVRLEAVDGRAAWGMAADLLVPKWFRKDPARSADADQQDLRDAVAAAAHELLRDAGGHRTVFDLWHAMHAARVQSQPPDAGDLLVRGFGTALLERAMIDAACRLCRKGFWSALQSGLLGIRLDAVHPELRGAEVRDLLPERPGTRLLVRHTVGMLDPLHSGEVAGAGPDDDGLPRSLEEYLRTDRPRWLKVKIGAGHDADRERLLAIAALCREGGHDVRFTLDGNEQFGDLEQVAELLEATAAAPHGRELLARTAFVEQPLSRAATFDAAANRGLARVTAFAPLLLDEADTGPAAFPRALRLGWRGCSVKNCKGVFRALANGALAARHEGAFLSAEDLTCLPLLALQQDLATVMTLGLPHVERNGHHYFRGLDHLPAAAVAAALAAHGDLYGPAPDGAPGARLCIADGGLQCASLLGPGFGCDQEPFDALAAALEWRPVAPGDGTWTGAAVAP